MLAAMSVIACNPEKETPVLEIPTPSYDVPAAGGEITVSVKSNTDWTVSCKSDADWYNSDVVTGNGDQDIVITVNANESEDGRSADFEVSTASGLARTFTVSQAGYSTPADAVNLSAEGTANCYIVAPGSVAYFKANVKGNGAEALEGTKGVKLVWQSEKALIKSMKLLEKSGNILVEVSETPGNAVVAATNEAGEIIWSWHLWVADYNPGGALFTTEANASGTTWTFMDRNLGATTMEKGTFGKNAGLIYQWGRKDPFPSAAGYTVQNEDYSYQEDAEPEYYDFDGNVLPKLYTTSQYEGSVALGIANPFVFYKVGSRDTGKVDEYGEAIYENVPRTSDWSDTSDDDAWGGVSMKKTIYDPCPVGYKVPVCDADGNTPYAWLTYAKREWDTQYYGATQDGQWFPTIGTRVYASGGLSYAEATPYSGIWIGTAGKASSNLDEYPTLYGQYMFIGSGKRTFKVNKDARSQGMSVRCVKEQ